LAAAVVLGFALTAALCSLFVPLRQSYPTGIR
jgi:multisubunit Na+/H+ antiporter MnhC subunit